MGHGSYSFSDRTTRATNLGYMTKSSQEIFTQRSINNAMNPYGIKIRESRDSNEHPNTIPIIIALDLTGSMGSVPYHLVKEGLPNMMQNLIDNKIEDTQVLFLGVGDHEYDNAPLQVGQFESSDELLDKWLTTVYLEGGGGANAGESYLLSWYFAAYHTVIDSFEKRGKKGFLFTIGDEPTLKNLPKSYLKKIMGDGQYQDFTADELLKKASEKYHIFHLHIKETYAGSIQTSIDDWKQLIKDNLIEINSHTEVPDKISNLILKTLKEDNSIIKVNVKNDVIETDNIVQEDEMML